MAGATAFPKSAQTAKRGKPDLAAAAAELAKADKPVKGSKPAADPQPTVFEFGGSASELDLSKIVSMRNPRILSSASEQKSLNESVKEHGVIQPISVRPMGDGTFAVIAGGRRLIAAKAAKLPTIPAVVAVVPDESQAFIRSLVENLQREDLNPIDEAKGYRTLLAETGMTQDALGKKIGRSQSDVANKLRLLELAPPVLELIEGGQLSATHGKSIAGLPADRQVAVAKQAVEQKLPTREVEEKIKREKEEFRRAEENRVRLEAEAAKCLKETDAFFAKRKLTKDGAGATTIIVGGKYNEQHLARALEAAGYQVRPEAKADRESPEWKCDEQNTTFSYSLYGTTFQPVCTVEKHHADYVKERDKVKHAETAKIEKKIDAAKAAVAKGIRSDEGKGLLNIDGQRLALFWLLVSHKPGEFSDSGRAEQFVKRHGGLRDGVTTVQEIDVFETIGGLSEADLGAELSKVLIAGTFVNVWNGERVEGGYAIREFLAGTFALGGPGENDLVWGGKMPSPTVLEQWSKRGRPLTPEQQASLDEVMAQRAAFSAKYAPAGAAASSDEDEDGDDESPTDSVGNDVAATFPADMSGPATEATSVVS